MALHGLPPWAGLKILVSGVNLVAAHPSRL